MFSNNSFTTVIISADSLESDKHKTNRFSSVFRYVLSLVGIEKYRRGQRDSDSSAAFSMV